MAGDIISMSALIMGACAIMCWSFNKVGYAFTPVDWVLMVLLGNGVFAIAFSLSYLFASLML